MTAPYVLAREVAASYDDTVAATRAALSDQGFGVLTEIDVRATMKEKLDVDVPAQVILGACRPQLAHRAMEIEPSIGALLPCNVVVRDEGERRTVEAIAPKMLVQATGNAALDEIAEEVERRLEAALDAVAGERS